MLEDFCKGDEMNYEEFCKYYGHMKKEDSCCQEPCTEWTKPILCHIIADFEAADTNKNGFLSFEEVCCVLEKGGFNGSMCDAKVNIVLCLHVYFCYAMDGQNTLSNDNPHITYIK